MTYLFFTSSYYFANCFADFNNVELAIKLICERKNKEFIIIGKKFGVFAESL
jgi:hypothetical protein